MAKEQGPMSGFRDILAAQMIPRDRILGIIKSVYELYGFTPLKTPALEKLDTLMNKYGDEGNKLMYKFEDNGGRMVALRYDHTVPLARVAAQHANDLPSPYKRYVIGDVWRGESPQAGRYREFTQFDADIIGTTSYLSEVEILAMMADAMAAIGVKTVIRLNDRRLLDGLAQYAGIDDHDQFIMLVTIIDKLEKIGLDKVLEEINSLFDPRVVEIVDDYLKISGNSEEKLEKIGTLVAHSDIANGLDNLKDIIKVLRDAGYREGVITFDQSIVRGLSYYTSTVYETSLVDLPELGSVCSGGRYDNLIEASGGPKTPAVGTSIGVDRLFEGLRQLGLLNEIKTNTKAYITNLSDKTDSQRFKLAQKLRNMKIPTELVYGQNKFGKQIATLEKLGLKKIIIFGEEEASRDVILIKDLDTSEQTEISISDIVPELFN